MALTLDQLVADFADSLCTLDGSRIQHKEFQPGIGPFGEPQVTRLVVDHLRARKPEQYSAVLIKRLPDMLVPNEWAIEIKIARPFGDNGREAEHWSENLLHPYEGNTSALGDCLKLLRSNLAERKAVLILGYEHTPPVVGLRTAVAAFELVAGQVLGLKLGKRVEEVRYDLIHPCHQQLTVFGFEVLGTRAVN